MELKSNIPNVDYILKTNVTYNCAGLYHNLYMRFHGETVKIMYLYFGNRDTCAYSFNKYNIYSFIDFISYLNHTDAKYIINDLINTLYYILYFCEKNSIGIVNKINAFEKYLLGLYEAK